MIMGEDFIAVSQRVILKSEIIHLKFTFASSARKLEKIKFCKCLRLVEFIYSCELRIRRGDNVECDRLRAERTDVIKLFGGDNSAIKLSNMVKSFKKSTDGDILKIVECVIQVVLGSYEVGMLVDKVEIVRNFPEHILCFDYVKKVFLFSSDPAICGRNKYLEGKLVERLSHFVDKGKSLVHKSGHCPDIEDHFPDVGVVEFLAPVDLTTLDVDNIVLSSTDVVEGISARQARKKLREQRLKDLASLRCTKYVNNLILWYFYHLIELSFYLDVKQNSLFLKMIFLEME
jgi:hypothetical protein